MKNTELQAARIASDKTQAQVAQETQTTEKQYQNYEYGKNEPGVRRAIRIADSVGVPVNTEFRKLWQNQDTEEVR